MFVQMLLQFEELKFLIWRGFGRGKTSSIEILLQGLYRLFQGVIRLIRSFF